MGPVDLDAIVRQLKIPVASEVLVGLETSDDAGVYRIGPDLNMVLTADFITPVCDDPFLFGRIAAANSLSDVYAMGGVPKACLNLCCFPCSGVSTETLTEILSGGLETITASGASLVGGHTIKDTEIKYGLSVTGIVSDADLKTNASAHPGDLLILTKPIGTGVVFAATKRGLIDQDTARPIFEHMAQLNKTAAELMVQAGASACTDVTGFGLGGHAWEMAAGSKVGIRFHASKVPHWPMADDLIAQGVRTGVILTSDDAPERKIVFDDAVSEAWRMLAVDPQTSGGLLIAIAESKASGLLARLVDAGIEDAAICGEVFAANRPSVEVHP